jgi:hypothetical protein
VSIKFVCEDCGKQLRARDQDAGKRTRCTGCAKVQRIPAGSGAEAAVAVVPVAAALRGQGEGEERLQALKEQLTLTALEAAKVGACHPLLGQLRHLSGPARVAAVLNMIGKLQSEIDAVPPGQRAAKAETYLELFQRVVAEGPAATRKAVVGCLGVWAALGGLALLILTALLGRIGAIPEPVGVAAFAILAVIVIVWRVANA